MGYGAQEARQKERAPCITHSIGSLPGTFNVGNSCFLFEKPMALQSAHAHVNGRLVLLRDLRRWHIAVSEDYWPAVRDVIDALDRGRRTKLKGRADVWVPKLRPQGPQNNPRSRPQANSTWRDAHGNGAAPVPSQQ